MSIITKRCFHRYIYCDKVELSPDTVLSIIHTSVKYSLTHLTKLCEKWMKDRISSKNVCAFLECAELLNKTELADKARQYIFHNAVDVLLDPTFCELPQDLLKVLLSSDELYVEEEYLYEACMRWARNQCREQGKEATASAIRQVLGQCILLFRFPVMEASKFVTLMDRFPDVLTKDEVVSVLKYFVSGKQTTFSSTPRKDDVVLRAHRFLKVAGDMWSINYGNPDAICFTTDKPVILKGIMVYGNDESFTNELTVEVVDENRATIYNETHKSFHSSGASHSIQFLFDEEVQIFPNKVYAIKQRTRVPKLHYGVNGQESVVSGNVTFHFSQYRLSNGTDVSRGQIPGLLFVRRHIKAFKVVSQ